MSKFVAKFRKEKDYSDDYSYSSKKKNGKRHDPVKRMMKQNYDNYYRILVMITKL